MTDELKALLNDIIIYLDRHSDVDWESSEDGSPRPNRAMKLIMQIEEYMEKIEQETNHV